MIRIGILNVPLSQDRYYEPIPDVCEISYTVTENTVSRTSVSFAINPAPLTTVRADISVTAKAGSGEQIGFSRQTLTFSSGSTSGGTITTSNSSGSSSYVLDPDITCHSISPSSFGNQEYEFVGES